MRYLGFLLFLCGCGSAAPGGPGDAGADVIYGHKSMDASFEAAPEAAATKTPWDRMTPHADVVLASIRLHAVYVTSGTDQPRSFDTLMQWMLASADYWSILAQYGVGFGTLASSVSVDASTFFPDGAVQNGTVDDWAIRQGIENMAADAGGASDAYIVFLPSSVDVGICSWALGYHETGGNVPYAVIPYCGASGVTVSHEIAEMATDPIPFAGWYSAADEKPAGGEVGDLCNFPVAIDGQYVTALWSNADGDCEPH